MYSILQQEWERYDGQLYFLPGYPQATEPKVLKEYICVQEKHKLAIQAIPSQVRYGVRSKFFYSTDMMVLIALLLVRI